MLAAVVCATDLSHRSDLPLGRAAQLARQHGVPLHVVHVVDPELPDTLWQAQKNEVRQEIRAALDRVAPQARDHAVVEVLTGFPNTQVAGYAHAIKDSLVVIGCPRLSKAGHLSFASFTAGRILRAAVAPVLIAKAPGTVAYRNVVVGIDLSPFSARAARLAAALAPDGAITLVHACQAADNTDQAAEAGRREKLDGFVSGLRAAAGAGAALSASSVVVRQGEAAQVLRAEAERLGADLLALGTHGRSSLSRALFGSVAEGMLKDMPCDLMISVPN